MTAIRPDIVLRFKFVSKAAGGVVMLIGLSVALSWICHAAGLGRPLSSLLTVPFSSALSLILCGVALLCLQDELRNTYTYPFAMACASAIVMLGFITLLQYVLGWHFELVPLLRNNIAAEALSNAVRHSQARHCVLPLRFVRGAVRLEVSDSGCGFDPLSADPEGQGLRNLSGCATKLGTQLRVVSSPGSGTRIILDIPKESAHDTCQI